MKYCKLLLLVIVGLALSRGVALAQGAMINGDNNNGSISGSGEIDVWTFTASAGDSISLSVGVVGTPTLRPKIQLQNPSSVEIASDEGVTLAQVDITAPSNGTYTVLISSGAGVPTGTGSYVLILAKIPGAFIVPPGDEGGPMTNGANHSGV